MMAALTGHCLKIRSPEAVRPWQHVLEPLGGYLLLAEKLCDKPVEYSQGWNFGPPPEDSRSVRWILDRLSRHWGGGVTWETDGRSNPHEAQLLTLDSAKARARLGWKPRWDLDQALKATVDWYRAYQQRSNLTDLIMQQIASYESHSTAIYSTSDCEIEA
jgi:CDP-glucose 4,6-dehydratase